MSSPYDGLPKSVRIGPYDITIEVKEKLTEDDDDFGHYDHGRLIKLREDQYNPTLAIDTLLHEILHGIYRCCGFDKESSEETLVTGLATGLTQVLRDNPGVLEWLAQMNQTKR